MIHLHILEIEKNIDSGTHVGLMVANQLSDHWRVMLKTRKMRGTTIKVSVEWKPYYKNKYNVIVKSKREEL